MEYGSLQIVVYKLYKQNKQSQRIVWYRLTKIGMLEIDLF